MSHNNKYISTKHHINTPVTIERENYEPQLTGAVWGYGDGWYTPFISSEQCFSDARQRCVYRQLAGADCNLDKQWMCPEDTSSVENELAGVS